MTYLFISHFVSALCGRINQNCSDKAFAYIITTSYDSFDLPKSKQLLS